MTSASWGSSQIFASWTVGSYDAAVNVVTSRLPVCSCVFSLSHTARACADGAGSTLPLFH